MTDQPNRTNAAAGDLDAPRGRNRWEEPEGATPDSRSAEATARPRRGFWERLGMLFNLHPRGPQGG